MNPFPGPVCSGCISGGECLFEDALIVNVLDIISSAHGSELNNTGLRLILRAAISEWHECAPGREALERLLDAAIRDGTTPEGLQLLLRRNPERLLGTQARQDSTEHP